MQASLTVQCDVRMVKSQGLQHGLVERALSLPLAGRHNVKLRRWMSIMAGLRHVTFAGFIP